MIRKPIRLSLLIRQVKHRFPQDFFFRKKKFTGENPCLPGSIYFKQSWNKSQPKRFSTSSIIFNAASGILVPGPKIANAPFS